MQPERIKRGRSCKVETGNNCFIVKAEILEMQSAAPSTGLFEKLELST